MSVKSYAVVSTENDGDISVDVIATPWLVDNDKNYYYPPSNMKKSLKCYVFEKCAGYDVKSWEKFPVRKIYAKNIKKLVEAHGIQKKYALESEQESSSSSKQRRAKRAKKSVQAPYSSSDEAVENVKKPSKKIQPKKKGANAIVKSKKKQQVSEESSSDYGNDSLSDSSCIDEMLKTPTLRKDDDCYENSKESFTASSPKESRFHTILPTPTLNSAGPRSPRNMRSPIQGTLEKNFRSPNKITPDRPDLSDSVVWSSTHSNTKNRSASNHRSFPKDSRQKISSRRSLEFRSLSAKSSTIQKTPEKRRSHPTPTRLNISSHHMTLNSQNSPKASSQRTHGSYFPKSPKKSHRELLSSHKSSSHGQKKHSDSAKDIRSSTRSSKYERHSSKQVSHESTTEKMNKLLIDLEVRLVLKIRSIVDEALQNFRHNFSMNNSTIESEKNDNYDIANEDIVGLPLEDYETFKIFEKRLETENHFKEKYKKYLRSSVTQNLKSSVKEMIGRTLSPRLMAACSLMGRGDNGKIPLNRTQIYACVIYVLKKTYPFLHVKDVNAVLSCKLTKFADSIKKRKGNIHAESLEIRSQYLKDEEERVICESSSVVEPEQTV